MNHKITLTLIALLTAFGTFAQDSVTYAVKNGKELKMDIYIAPAEIRQPEVVMYVFGGAFYEGKRQNMADACRKMNARGFTCVAIDYRLRFKEEIVNDTLNLTLALFEDAIGCAIEDISSAIIFLKANGERWGIDADKIVIAGNSAGAIAAMQADWSLQNGYKWTKELPEGYRFAGIMSYAGGIFSRKGRIKYAKTPAPTMMYHGTRDMIVPYKKIVILKNRYCGTNEIAKIFKKKGYSAQITRFQGAKHEVNGFYDSYIDEAVSFIEKFVRSSTPLYEDTTLPAPKKEVKENETKSDETKDETKNDTTEQKPKVTILLNLGWKELIE